MWYLWGGEALRRRTRPGELSGQPNKIPTAGAGVRVIARRVAKRYRLTAIGHPLSANRLGSAGKSPVPPKELPHGDDRGKHDPLHQVGDLQHAKLLAVTPR